MPKLKNCGGGGRDHLGAIRNISWREEWVKKNDEVLLIKEQKELSPVKDVEKGNLSLEGRRLVSSFSSDLTAHSWKNGGPGKASVPPLSKTGHYIDHSES